MPPRPPACYKAVRLPLSTPSDSIWVSDEALTHAFHRFCSISRTSRRHGSFVPGPMEARRRLGNRRMTHVSEAIPSAVHNMEPLWGPFKEADRTKWQWQAPTPRPSTEDKNVSALPAWLLEWDTTSQAETAEIVDVKITAKRTPEDPFGVEDNIRKFGEMIKGTLSRNGIQKISADFALQFKKSISLGLVSQDVLDYALISVSEDLQTAIPDKDLKSYIGLTFYTQVWDGIVESKVLEPADIDAKVMSRLFSLVISLPLDSGVKELAQKMLHSATAVQLRHMEQSLTSLVTRWTECWLKQQKPDNHFEGLQSAECSVIEAEQKLTNARRLVMMLGEGSNDEQALNMAHKAIHGAHAAITAAIDATINLENIMWPLQASVKGLAQALEKLPAEMLLELVPDWSQRIFQSCTGKSRLAMQFAYPWLCAIARLPNVDYELLVQTWRQVDPARRLHQSKCCQVILEHWISQGKVTKPSSVRIAFDASLEPSMLGGSWSFARLLLALDKQRQQSFSRTNDVFDLLHKLERSRYIPQILIRMEELNMKIPTTSLASAVERMSYDKKLVRQALQMWYLPDHMKAGYRLRPELVPNFIINLINTPSVSPGEIWKLLGIPLYDDLVGKKFQFHQAKPLPREMIDLLHKMATAFAYSEVRPPRVAFRNITQCLHHLRVHNAPISPEMTRAVSHCYVTKSILRGLYVGQERLRYCLYLISQVEGEDVAKRVDETVWQWRRVVDEKSARVKREANVLRVGPLQ